MHVRQLLISSAAFNAFQNIGNLYTGYWYRYETTHGKWWDRYVNSVAGWRWDSWSDGNPMMDVYVGHPIMGAITNYIWLQNDPKSMTLAQSNTWPYWRSLLRAGAFSTVYSFEWKFGPLGEAAIGHNGDHYFYDEKGKVYTNETGVVELVTTPGGGMLWSMAEDALDQHVVRRLEGVSRNPFALIAYQFLTPARGTANFLRFRPPWYRDSRTVKAASFFSDPPHPDERLPESAGASSSNDAGYSTGPMASAATRLQSTPTAFPRPGGVHELGTWYGLSLISGHLVGSAKDVKYMPIDVSYSYELNHWDHWTLRYAPEFTALAMIDEPVPGQTDRMLHRKRTYGSGISPLGVETDLFPSRRIQPFLSTHGGMLYFLHPVLSPQGSNAVYIGDFGAGLHLFRKARQSVTLGYRYQILSDVNGAHSARTDANTFYVAVSRYRTKGYY